VTAQLPLFGAQSIHIGLGGYCVACRVLLSLADSLDECGICPGFVEPAPAGWGLGEAPAELEQAEAA
jgi:hypothetical protein